MDTTRETPQQPATENEEEIEQEAERSREALDAIPPPGTDPLHEGP